MSRRGTREGSIYRRSDGYWAAAISLGAGRRKVIYGKTRAAVAAKLVTTLREQQQGVAITSSQRLAVGMYLTRWLGGAESSVRGSTFKRYSELVRVHLVPRIGSIPLAKLGPADLAAMYAGMLADGIAPSTAVLVHRVLARALREAEAADIIARNVTRLVRPPRVPHMEMRTLSAEQARSLIETTAGDRMGALYAVALASGARLGELLALTWQDTDLERGSIRITRTLTRTARGWEIGEPKTSASRRTVPVGRTAATALRTHRRIQTEERVLAGSVWHAGDLVFADEIGRPIDGTHVSHAFGAVLARAALPRVRFHDLRHTAATLLLEAGLHPRVVAERLGHSTPSLVMNTYGHVTERMQTEATATLDRVLGA